MKPSLALVAAATALLTPAAHALLGVAPALHDVSSLVARAAGAVHDEAAMLAERDEDAHLYTRDVDELDLEERGEWLDVDSFGLMMARDVDGNDTISKRDSFSDIRSHIFVERDEQTGLLRLPRSYDEAKHLVSRGLEKAKRSSLASVIITWYTGHDLLAPSCVSHSRWAPTDRSMVTATTEYWSGAPGCGKFIALRAKGGKKACTVRIVDTCAGCARQSAHFDLTKKAFQTLYGLDVGQVSGLQAKVVGSPVKGKWSGKYVNLYGPQKL